MEQTEKQWDKVLGIRTGGRDDSKADAYNYPYEPTPYEVLRRLENSGYITKQNTVVDYGCGKGRVDFYLSFQIKCHSIGIEYDERMYLGAMKNRENGAARERVKFVLQKAQAYQVPEAADRFYFFNPFSVDILKSVLERIRESVYKTPRDIMLFFYYPSDEYISYLMMSDEFSFFDEIDCSDLFEGMDSRETIVIFEWNAYAINCFDGGER